MCHEQFCPISKDQWFFCQYYAKGDAWHLPEEAYETLIFLKDAGGHVVQVLWCFF